MNDRSSESRTERITIRWPEEVKNTLEQRAKARMRSVSAEVRELLTYARNTIPAEKLISIGEYGQVRSTSVSITPRLRHWLFSRAQLNDRTIQIELLSLITFALDHIMERDLALLLGTDQAPPASG